MSISSIKKILVTFLSVAWSFVYTQTTIINSGASTSPNGSFENGTSSFPANGWTVKNDATNKWFVGTSAFNSGSKGAYIGTATGNNNYTNNTAQVSHFYQDVTFPSGESCITLSFNWKGDGENAYDFLKVYLTNTTTAVNSGAQQSASDQLGVEYSKKTSWQNVTLTIPASNSGTTKRLVFSWRNDGSGGVSPAAAIDNISLVSAIPPVPNCASYNSPTNGITVCPAPQTLVWSALAAPTCGTITYDVYFNAGTTATSLVSSSQPATSFVTPALSGGTTYAWKIVPKNGTTLALGCSTYTFSTGSVTSNSIVPLTDSFESCSDWTSVNGAEANIWVQGSATNNGGSQSMYITNNGGTTNTYNNAASSVVHFYKDIKFPAGLSCITLNFDWRATGESCCDYLKVFGVSVSTNPSAGAQLGTGLLGTYNVSSSYQTESVTLPASYAGTTQRIVFSWRNDGSVGTNPAAAVDNISLVASVPPSPTCASYNSPTNGLSVCPTPQTLSWNAIVAPTCGNITYDVYFNAGTTATSLASSAQTGTSFITPLLISGTTYAWKIVPRNGTLLAAGCSTYTFSTGTITSNSVAPLTDNFESCSDFILVNGAENNSWIQGNATNNGGSQSMYITNNGGVSNAYTNNSTSTVHFYKDIKFPAGLSCITLNFDWKTYGESCCDYLKVFAVPIGTNPVAGTQLVTGLLGTYNVSASYQTASITLPATYAGTTQRIVFSWRNDGSVGTNPPAAVDNISISTSLPQLPNCITGAIFPIDGITSLCPTASLTLTWTPPSVVGCNDATNYNLFLGTNNPPTNIINGIAVGNVTSYVLSGLSSTDIYHWKVVPTNGAGSASGCSTYTFSYASSPANDLPCNAVNIPLGTIASGNNDCSSNIGEPSTPGCWTGGTVNTVWYSFIAPSSGNVKIRTAPGTLLNTQIAVYSGACGSGMTSLGCNKNAPNCGTTAVLASELSITGLTNGVKYYIAVDGGNSLLGTFAITVIEASSTYPETSGQTCGNSILACNSSINIGNPGYQGIGFTCDNDGTGNCTSGERGSVWYTINVSSAGQLNFTILANDYDMSTPGTETDYDFVLWKTSGTGAVSCSSISAGAPAIACNYGGDGVTGLAPGGNAPPPYSTGVYNDDFEPSVTVAAGDTYLLLIQNYSNSIAGFSLDLSGTSAGVVNYTPPTTLTWSGGANTDTWTSAVNWGGCITPDCSVSANISTASSFQPLISSIMGTVTVNDLTIDPGAVLTLGPNSHLKICGNLTNNGSVLADASSTITFADNASHTFNGTLSGSSTLGNVVITDAVGGLNCNIITNTDIELKGSLTTSNPTSIFNLNGKNLMIAGNFNNSSGSSTFSNTAVSTITFKGNSLQTYNPNMNSATPSLILNNVIMNNSGAGVILSTTNTPNMILGVNGILTLTSGKIVTPGSQEVIVTNLGNVAVSAGNTTSYIQGNLRRYLAASATGSYDFPVGHVTVGYERANLNFTTGAAVGAINLLARFDPWGGSFPLPSVPNWSECGTTYNLSYLNHGFWTINASATSTGLYNLTLYNRNYSNATGSGFSIAKSPSAAPSWTLNGTCLASAPTAVTRNAMSGFSKMGIIQGVVPLPVELIEFGGNSESSYNSIYWKSAVEVNFSHYELESSEDGIDFTKITSINPLGNVSSLNHYNYLDFNHYSPITYYRLKMVDRDYTFKYSNIIALENGLNKSQSLIVYPNPASNELFIKLSIPGEKEATLTIHDVLGRNVHTQKIDLTQGIDNTYINTSGYPTGTYVVKISSGNTFSENIKVVIAKTH